MELGVWIGAWSSELGASSLGVWIEAWRALCVSSACERAEWKMFEVKMRTEMIFPPRSLILRSN